LSVVAEIDGPRCVDPPILYAPFAVPVDRGEQIWSECLHDPLLRPPSILDEVVDLPDIHARYESQRGPKARTTVGIREAVVEMPVVMKNRQRICRPRQVCAVQLSRSAGYRLTLKNPGRAHSDSRVQ